ncbi:hypothetical protein GCM10027290_50090 [Micromonospora sonneratiae]|uniref:Zf-HC2 domain-containing protein n=1 Tax=Micromonospora sonneratiae TaxID=1184706 RepID=A0ABW3YLM1_9ACTN
MTWHVPPELLVDYDTGRLDPARVMAVEAHLARCSACRSAVPADEAWLDRNWNAVLEVVDSPRRNPVEWLFARLGLPEHRARLLAATPALRWSWLTATVAVLAFAVLAAHLAEGGWPMMAFLLVAPVLPVLAVATAYGPQVDPMHEITATTPTAGPGLVLWRAATVLVVSLGLGTVASMFLPPVGWLALAWLLPALCLCLGSLALATVLPLQVAAGGLVTAWLVAVVALLDRSGDPYPAPAVRHLFEPVAQSGFLVAAVCAAAVLIMRRRRLDVGEPR